MAGAPYRIIIDGVAGEVLAADGDGRTITMDTGQVRDSIVVEWGRAPGADDSGKPGAFLYSQHLSLGGA
jgi:hypothetical protein